MKNGVGDLFVSSTELPIDIMLDQYRLLLRRQAEFDDVNVNE